MFILDFLTTRHSRLAPHFFSKRKALITHLHSHTQPQTLAHPACPQMAAVNGNY